MTRASGPGALTAGVVVSALLLAGCAQTAGAPIPVRPQDAASLSAAPSQAPSGEPSGSDPDEERALPTGDPCELLTPAERSTAGLTSLGIAKDIGPTRACDWNEPGAFGLTVTLDGQEGLSDLRVPDEDAEPSTIGGRDALVVADERADNGTCAVLLAAGDSASVHVDVSNTSFTDTDLACDRARTVAELIGPKLP
jgi:hypothetical protein